MATTRYVWDIYGIEKETTESQTIASNDELVVQSSGRNIVFRVGTGYTINSDGSMSLTGAVTEEIPSYTGGSIRYTYKSCFSYPYCGRYNTLTHQYITILKTSEPNWYWQFQYMGDGYTMYLSIVNSSTNHTAATTPYSITITTSIVSTGTKTGNVSSKNRSAYPDDGHNGASWYKYKGSDNIDPLEVTYSTVTLKRGETFTVGVVPGTGKTQGGTVLYQYQYSTDNGSVWKNEGESQSSISKQMTVPLNATQFMARVFASDEWGFISETYVKGENLQVELVTDNYLIFANAIAVNAYNESLTHVVPDTLTNTSGNYDTAGTSIGDYALFFSDKYTDSYDKALTKTLKNQESISITGKSASNIGQYALFAGGYGYNGGYVYFGTVNSYSSSLNKGYATNLSVSRKNICSSKTDSHALFAGGISSSGVESTVDAYNSSLTRTIPEGLSIARAFMSATKLGKHTLFAGGKNKESSNGTVFSTVDVYDDNLTRSTITELSVARSELAATTLGVYAMFGGGDTGNSVPTSVMDVYDNTLTRTINTDLSLARRLLAAGTIGVYSLFAGGMGASASDIVDVYRHI